MRSWGCDADEKKRLRLAVDITGFSMVYVQEYGVEEVPRQFRGPRRYLRINPVRGVFWDFGAV